MSEIKTQKITSEFCKGKRIVFHPKTPEEARFIQEKLIEMDFGWRTSGKHILYCDELQDGTLYLEDGMMHYSGKSRNTDGLLCDVRQFEKSYQPPKTLDDVFNLVAEMKKEIDSLRAQVAELHQEIMPKPLEKPSVDILKKNGMK